MYSVAHDLSAILLSVFHAIDSTAFVSIVQNILKSYGRKVSSVWVSCILVIYREWLSSEMFTPKWVAFHFSISEAAIKTLPLILSLMEEICSIFPPPSSGSSGSEPDPGNMMWTHFLETTCLFLRSSSQKTESFDSRKARVARLLHADHRHKLGKLLYTTRSVFRLTCISASFISLTPEGFFPTLLDISMNEISAVRVTSIDMIYGCIQDCFVRNGELKEIEKVLINGIRALVELSSCDDEHFNLLFSTLDARLQMDQTASYYDETKSVFKMLKKYSKLLGAHLIIKSRASEDFISSLLQLIKFCKQHGYQDMWYKHSANLYKTHLNLANYVEAAMTLCEHAEIIDWDSQVEDILSNFGSLSETAPSNKESIYMVCIQLFCQGGAWERAIHLSNKLRKRYLFTHDYQSQADNLQFQATLYNRIASEERFFPSYYRVIFHGKDFNKGGSKAKQLIYRGNNWEQIGTFCERMKELYDCVIISNTAPVDASITQSNGRYLQICAVNPAPDFREWDIDNSAEGLFSLIDVYPSTDSKDELCPIWVNLTLTKASRALHSTER